MGVELVCRKMEWKSFVDEAEGNLNGVKKGRKKKNKRREEKEKKKEKEGCLCANRPNPQNGLVCTPDPC